QKLEPLMKKARICLGVSGWGGVCQSRLEESQVRESVAADRGGKILRGRPCGTTHKLRIAYLHRRVNASDSSGYGSPTAASH
ncbi:MAG: hypothetical protein ACRD2L_18450, partial [Terriglobia bacterium]